MKDLVIALDNWPGALVKMARVWLHGHFDTQAAQFRSIVQSPL